MVTTKHNHTPLTQREGALAFAAAGTRIDAAGTEPAIQVHSSVRGAAGNAAAVRDAHAVAPPVGSCQQCLTLSFFFDGTGNNLEADVGTMQHSNVARLFLSHRDDAVNGVKAIYIPGIGTYFKDIGDVGHTTRGLGFGHMGQERLDWAFARFDEAIRKAELRANNPTNKIRSIRVSVFGFSRGATLARAFVRELAARCDVASGQWRLKVNSAPIEVIFLGLFDTVASVGLPMSANNTPGATSTGVYDIETTLKVRGDLGANNILSMAFGAPGADPAPGAYDGHAAWADGLRVPGLVSRCVHMVAGHEFRNSFPVDSVLDGTRYPVGCSEMVYPGAHSDVGGGYQPGEGARSPHSGDMLSLIPLRAMHAEALRSGVPIRSLSAMSASDMPSVFPRSFALDDESAAKFAELNAHFQRYLKHSGSGGRDIGREVLAHAALFLRWRFFSIRRQQRGNGPDQQTVPVRERGFARERATLERSVWERNHAYQRARLSAMRANERYNLAEQTRMRTGAAIPHDVSEVRDIARAAEAQAQDAYLREKARLDTYANDSGLLTNMATYDARLLRDAERIVAHHRLHPTLSLRPHYKNLVEAYEAQFVRGETLDADVVAFFDRYVHDSLAGFATDATLPSDPRVIYAGGDNKFKYAAIGDFNPNRRAA